MFDFFAFELTVILILDMYATFKLFSAFCWMYEKRLDNLFFPDSSPLVSRFFASQSWPVRALRALLLVLVASVLGGVAVFSFLLFFAASLIWMHKMIYCSASIFDQNYALVSSCDDELDLWIWAAIPKFCVFLVYSYLVLVAASSIMNRLNRPLLFDCEFQAKRNTAMQSYKMLETKIQEIHNPNSTTKQKTIQEFEELKKQIAQQE